MLQYPGLRGMGFFMSLWIIFVIIYSILKGSRDGMKKAALKKSSSSEILFFYTLIGFILTLPFSYDAFLIKPSFILFAFIKALVICISWLLSMNVLKKMSVSLYGIMDLSRMIFSMMFGVLILGESLTVAKIAGGIVVVTGLVLANMKKETENKGVAFAILIIALISCLFNSLSGVMDKIAMKYITSSQLQFWFMFFLTLLYGIILLIKKERISVKSLKTNYWIPLMSISLVLGDKLFFEANANPLSEITLITIIKQSSVIVTVLSGWLIFKEKHILYKMMCAGIVLSGIFIAIFA